MVKGGNTHPTELHNVKLVGDNVAIEGWMGIGADNKVKEFRFPQFSLNVVDQPRDATASCAPTTSGR